MARTASKKSKGSGKKSYSVLEANDAGEGQEDSDLPKDEAGRRKIKRQYETLLGIRIEKLKGRILNRERINKTIEGVYFICAECKKVCHNMDDGLVEDPNNTYNLCGACAKTKGKGQAACVARRRWSPRRREVPRRWAVDRQLPGADRMAEAEPGGVQHQARRRRPTVERVAAHRMAGGCEVDAYLMAHAGCDLDRQQGGAAASLERPIAGERRARAQRARLFDVGAGAHGLWPARVVGDRLAPRAGAGDVAVDPGQVALLDLAPAELFTQIAPRIGAARRQEHAGGAGVEAMDEPRL